MSKYNASKIMIDDIQFDSKAEGRYYVYLKEQKAKGIIKDFSLQPEFVLQDGFELADRKIRPIKYRADFKVEYHDGNEDIIDIKGMLTTDFKLKKKLFEYKYRQELICLKYVVKFGGWVTLDEYDKRKKEEKKNDG